jgi:integrase
MPKRLLMPKGIANLPVPATGRIDYNDTVQDGLSLRVTSHGARSWAVRYYLAGRQRRATLGTYPDLGLADARKRAHDARQDAHDGKDRATVKREQRTIPTFEKVSEDYITKWAEPRKTSWKDDARRLRGRALKPWGSRLITEITRADVRELLAGVAASAPIEANRLLALIRKLFNWAINEELVSVNPCAAMPRPSVEHARDRVLSDDEVRAAWSALGALPAGVAGQFKLQLLTAVRFGEVESMRWADVDLAAGWWSIPATTTKNKIGHRVALSKPALAILQAQRAAVPKGAAFVFEGSRAKRLRHFALFGGQAKKGGPVTLRGADGKPIANLRPHDLRRTVVTRLASAGVIRPTIKALLNHVDPGVTAVYDRSSHDEAKRAALDQWATMLESILQPPAPAASGSNVRAFRRAVR